MQEDTYRGDGLNLYAYCANNPVRYIDPSGHWCIDKQNIYERLVKENGLDIHNIDPDTKLRLMAEAANIVKGFNAGQDNRDRESLKPVADTPNDGRRDERVSSTIHNDILDSPRIGSALTVDKIKPTYAVDPKTGRTYMVQEFPAGAQAHGVLYQLEGSLNGVSGRFEWIIQDDQVTHRMFIQNGTMNGVPIKP